MLSLRWLRRVFAPVSPTPCRSRRHTRPTLEPLETRLTPTVKLIYGEAGTALWLTETTPGNDQVTIAEPSPGLLEIRLAGGNTFDAGSSQGIVSYASPGRPEASSRATVPITAAGAITTLGIDTGAGTDRLNLGLTNASGGVGQVLAGKSGGGTLATFLSSLRLPGGSLTVSDGPVVASSGSTLRTEGGNITLTGAGTGNLTSGVQVIGATLDAGGGNIRLTGTGADGTSHAAGVLVHGSQVTTSGLGRVTLLGAGGNGTDRNHGVVVSSSSRVRVVDGALTLLGTGRGFGEYNIGVDVVAGSTVQATGSGTITIDGTSGTGTNGNIGVVIHGAGTLVTGVNGDVTLLGLGRGTGSSAFGVDVETAAVVETTGTGRLTLTGTGGPGTLDSYGILIWNDGPQVRTANADLTVTGISRGFANDNYGIDLERGAVIQAGGRGNVSLRGVGGGGTDFCIGVVLNSGSLVRSADGDLTITGFGNGSGRDGFGIDALTGAVVEATGRGRVALIGVGGDGTYENHGVVLYGDGTLARTAGGDLSVSGTGGGGGARVGISAQASALLSAGALPGIAPGRVFLASIGDAALESGARVRAAGGAIAVQTSGNFTLASGATLQTSGAGTLLLQVDAGNPAPGVGAVATFSPTALQAPAGITVQGGPDTDALHVDLTGPISGRHEPADRTSGQLVFGSTVIRYVQTEVIVPVPSNGGPGVGTLTTVTPAGDCLTGFVPRSADTAGRFVERLYALRLCRAASSAEVEFWRTVLQVNGREAVVRAIDASPEARGRLVAQWYRDYLGRTVAADSAEIQGWVRGLLAGVREEQVQLAILGSEEFLRRARQLTPAANDAESFVRTLYNVLLNRAPRAEEVSWWVSVLPLAGRPAVVQFFLQAPEHRSRVISTYYDTLLQRPADAGGLSYWVNVPLTLQDVRVAIASSEESFRKS